MEGSGGAAAEKRKHSRQSQQEKPYRGIRMRKWGKWLRDLSAADIRKKATEVGARVDALQSALHASAAEPTSPTLNQNRVVLFKPDLNEYPSPESSEEDI
nr:ethylene-responsive transcription factor RAP2-1-like [Ipomoea trifida]GMD91418.1 ethylene-responsive transcription factor ERF011-like [Ipomoea batatas]